MLSTIELPLLPTSIIELDLDKNGVNNGIHESKSGQKEDCTILDYEQKEFTELSEENQIVDQEDYALDINSKISKNLDKNGDETYWVNDTNLIEAGSTQLDKKKNINEKIINSQISVNSDSERTNSRKGLDDYNYEIISSSEEIIETDTTMNKSSKMIALKDIWKGNKAIKKRHEKEISKLIEDEEDNYHRIFSLNSEKELERAISKNTKKIFDSDLEAQLSLDCLNNQKVKMKYPIFKKSIRLFNRAIKEILEDLSEESKSGVHFKTRPATNRLIQFIWEKHMEQFFKISSEVAGHWKRIMPNESDFLLLKWIFKLSNPGYLEDELNQFLENIQERIAESREQGLIDNEYIFSDESKSDSEVDNYSFEEESYERKKNREKTAIIEDVKVIENPMSEFIHQEIQDEFPNKKSNISKDFSK